MFDAMIPGRTLSTQGNTLLTLTKPEGDLARQQADLILTVFSKQAPDALLTTTALAL